MDCNLAPSNKGNIKCTHIAMKWFETIVFDEEGVGTTVRIYSCPDCGERGRA